MEFLWLVLIVLLVMLAFLCAVLLRSPHDKTASLQRQLAESERRQQAQLMEVRQAMLQELQQMNGAFRQEIFTWKEASMQQMYAMEKNVSHTMQHGYEACGEVVGRVLEKVGRLDEGQRHVQELSRSLSLIQNVLTDKKTRGVFGEIELYHLLENAMGESGAQYAKQYRLSSGVIADAVLLGKEPLGLICIDSKFPLENYNRMAEAQRKEDQRRYHQIFVQDVKKHIQTIAEKYIIPQETADFAYLFLPAEAVFSYLYASCEDVVKYSYEQHVYMVSPTTLMAYITAIKAIYLGVERNENIVLIQKELKRLQIEFERFEKRYQSAAADFERCYEDMRLLQITAGKLLSRFREIEAVKLHEER